MGLAPGTYLGEVVLEAASGNVSVPVTLVVLATTTNTFQQAPALNFTMPAGGPNPLSQLLTIASTGSVLEIRWR